MSVAFTGYGFFTSYYGHINKTAQYRRCKIIRKETKFNESFVKKEFQEMRAIMDRMMAQFGAQMGFCELDPEIVGVYNECVKLFNVLEKDALDYAREQDNFNTDLMEEFVLIEKRDQIMIGMIKDLADEVKKANKKSS